MFYIGYEPDVGGIGDFIYILFGAFCWCKKYNVEMGICIPAHPLNKCINCIKEEPEGARIIRCITKTNVSCVLTDEIARHRGGGGEAADVVVYSNMNDYLHIYLEYMSHSLKKVLLEEFRRDVLKYTDFIEERIYDFISHNNSFDTHFSSEQPQQQEYFAIHLRCGDRYLRTDSGLGTDSGNNSNSSSRCNSRGAAGEKRIKNIDIAARVEAAAEYFRTGAVGAQIYFFCDNQKLREQYAQKYGFLYLPTKIIHIADAADASTSAAVIDSFCEFVILSRAKCVVALTKSNFSYVSSLIGGAEYVYIT